MQVVEDLLKKDARCRDEDKLLTALLWYDVVQKKGLVFNNMTAKDLLDLYISGVLPNHDSITRARRKVQETMPHLRGDKYNLRQGHQEEVKKDLGYGRLD